MPIALRLAEFQYSHFQPETDLHSVTLVHHIGNSSTMRHLETLPVSEFTGVIIMSKARARRGDATRPPVLCWAAHPPPPLPARPAPQVSSEAEDPMASDSHCLASLLLVRALQLGLKHAEEEEEALTLAAAVSDDPEEEEEAMDVWTSAALSPVPVVCEIQARMRTRRPAQRRAGALMHGPGAQRSKGGGWGGVGAAARGARAGGHRTRARSARWARASASPPRRTSCRATRCRAASWRW